MESKSERTRIFILEKVSPIFNQKGFAGTSLRDLTEVTGLTKGALYAHFQNKEDLAIESLRYNIFKVLEPLSHQLQSSRSPIQKLILIADYYTSYYDMVKPLGGCPLLKVGMDTRNLNTRLFEKVKSFARKLENQLKEIILEGINRQEIKSEISPDHYASLFYSMIEGSIFMAFLQDDPEYLTKISLQLKKLIQQDLLF